MLSYGHGCPETNSKRGCGNEMRQCLIAALADLTELIYLKDSNNHEFYYYPWTLLTSRKTHNLQVHP